MRVMREAQTATASGRTADPDAALGLFATGLGAEVGSRRHPSVAMPGAVALGRVHEPESGVELFEEPPA